MAWVYVGEIAKYRVSPHSEERMRMIALFISLRELFFRNWFGTLFLLSTPCLTRPRSFLETGFRPLYPSFVWFVPLSRTKRVFWISTRKPNFKWSWVGASWRVRHPPYSMKLFVRPLPCLTLLSGAKCLYMCVHKLNGGSNCKPPLLAGARTGC